MKDRGSGLRSAYNPVLFCELLSGAGAFKPLKYEGNSIKFCLKIYSV